MKFLLILYFANVLLCASAFFIHTITEEVARNIISILYGELTEIVGTCDQITPNKIKFLLYNPDYQTNPVHLTNRSTHLINPNLPTKLLIHGWIGSAFTNNIINIRKTYLKKAPYNIIAVDWSAYAVVNYATAHCNLPKVGKIVGNFLQDMVLKKQIRLEATHLIGHSMGAHVAAFAGKTVWKAFGKRIARITGLDPAGPLYVGLPEKERLARDDAQFVDVIHTNTVLFGYPTKLGHADFYPNCGFEQNGCRKYDLTDNVTIIKEIRNEIFCNHDRSNQYFIESVNSDGFVGRKCLLCRAVCSKKKTVMGDGCSSGVKGVYFLSTNAKPPFAQG